MPGSERLDALAQRRCAVVEVDPRAPIPQLTPDRDKAEIVGAEVAFGEDLRPQHERVGAVQPPAPPVKRAGKAATGPAALDDLHSAMAAGVVERTNVVAVQSHHDDRLVEDLVLHEVAARGNLLET